MVEGLTVGRAKAHITTEAFNIAPSLVMRGRTWTAVKEILIRQVEVGIDTRRAG
jgi:hypothetical protein